MSTTCASKISWSRSPTRSYIACDLEVLGEPALDVVDQRELGVALARLLEQPRVLERDAEAAGERGEEPDVRSLNACSRSRFCSETTPVAFRPTTSGTNTTDIAGSPWSTAG